MIVEMWVLTILMRNPEIGETYLWEFVSRSPTLPGIKQSKFTKVIQR